MEQKITALTLRIILSIALLLLLIGGAVGFMFVRGILVAQATETAKVTAQASTSQNNVQNLQKALKELNENSATEEKVGAMIATNLKYTYQDQIVTTLKALGTSAGVKITNIGFEDPTKVSAAPTPPSGPSVAPAAPSAVPADIKLTQANVSLATPVRYDSLLTFLHYVEQNTMSMKVSKLSISSAGDSKDTSQQTVNCDVLTIGVYTR